MEKYFCTHIYTEESIPVNGFTSISNNWLTCTTDIDYYEARKLYEKLNMPVASLCAFLSTAAVFSLLKLRLACINFFSLSVINITSNLKGDTS